MHSRIFQVSLDPIDKWDYIEEADYWDHWFTREWADYVTGCDRNDSIEWLKDYGKNRGLTFGEDSNGEYFIIANKEKFFEGKFEYFKGKLEKLRECTLEQFAGLDRAADIHGINSSYNDKTGFYIELVDGGLYTMDDFIRCHDNGEKYYIGGTLDYHW